MKEIVLAVSPPCHAMNASTSPTPPDPFEQNQSNDSNTDDRILVYYLKILPFNYSVGEIDVCFNVYLGCDRTVIPKI